jgi:hypothetical protein
VRNHRVVKLRIGNIREHRRLHHGHHFTASGPIVVKPKMRSSFVPRRAFMKPVALIGSLATRGHALALRVAFAQSDVLGPSPPRLVSCSANGETAGSATRMRLEGRKLERVHLNGRQSMGAAD